MKKIIWFIVLIILCTTLSISAYSESLAENKLFCDNNGNFTILVVSDPQCDTKAQWIEAKNELEILVARSKPDLVIINGDMNSHNIIPADMWDTFISPIVSRKIFWCTTNGNHDPYNARYYKMYKSYEKCLNIKVNTTNPNYENARPMNYVIPIYSNNKKNIVFAVYCMDTGTSNRYGYEGLTTKQIRWYKQQSDNLKQLNSGDAVTSLLCMHIPLTQTLDMFYSAIDGGDAISKRTGGIYNVYGITNQNSIGVKNYICENGTKIKNTFLHTTAPQNDRGMFNAILNQGDIKAVIFGHEHQTNLIGSYKGILLGFAGKVSTGCYSDTVCRGGRVIKFDQKNPQNFTVSWIGSMPTSQDQPAIHFDGTLVQQNVENTH